MPSTMHEALIQIFQHRPAFVADLLDGTLGVKVPAFQEARLESPNLTDLVPTEYRADAVVVLSQGTTTVLAVIVEVQLGPDQGKRWSWPAYMTTLRARLRCPTILMVVSVDAAVATWCSTPIDLGHPGLVLCPVVVDPKLVPLITDETAAALDPEMAVLSALAHGTHPDVNRVLSALTKALPKIDQDLAMLYSDIVFVALPQAARQYLEGLMALQTTYRLQSDFWLNRLGGGRAEGRAEGKAQALLTVLDARGFDVPQEVHDRITECTDLLQLNLWILRAVTAESISDLFV